METRLKMQRRNQAILANVVLLAALLFERFVGHPPKIVVLAGVFLLLAVNFMFIVTWKRNPSNEA